MRPGLVELYRRFATETALLTQVLESTPELTNRHHLGQEYQRFVCEMCIIRLHDAWARFCRELIVMSAYARPFTAQGQRVSRAPGIQGRHQVIPALLATYRKRTMEPFWHIPNDCLDAARRLNISNYPTIMTGLGLSFPQSATDQLRNVRNFLAHRNASTARDVEQVARNLGLLNVRYPYLLVVSVVQPGASVFALWVHQLRTMAWSSIQ